MGCELVGVECLICDMSEMKCFWEEWWGDGEREKEGGGVKGRLIHRRKRRYISQPRCRSKRKCTLQHIPSSSSN